MKKKLPAIKRLTRRKYRMSDSSDVRVFRLLLSRSFSSGYSYRLCIARELHLNIREVRKTMKHWRMYNSIIR